MSIFLKFKMRVTNESTSLATKLKERSSFFLLLRHFIKAFTMANNWDYIGHITKSTYSKLEEIIKLPD